MRIAVSPIVLSCGLLFGAATLKADTQLDWHLRHSGESFALYGLAFGHGRYVAVGYNDVYSNAMLTSLDGVNWSALTPPANTNYLKHIAFGNNVFIMANAMQNWRSVNGIDWTPIDNGAGQNMGASRRLRFLNGQFWELRGTSNIRRSPDGLDWTIVQYTQAYTHRYNDITAGAGKLVIVGQDTAAQSVFIAYSTNNGANWTIVPSDIDNRLLSVAYGNGRFVAVGGYGAPHGVIMTSADGQNWTALTNDYDYILYRVIYDGGLFVIAGDAGTVLVSSDGLNWTLQWDDHNQVVGRGIHDICRAQGQYLGVGARGTIIQSGPGGAQQPPTPGIQANGATGAIDLDAGEEVTVTITIEPGDYSGANVDWWLLAAPVNGDIWYYLDAQRQWTAFTAGDLAACRPVHAGPLMSISAPYPVLPDYALQPGAYVFHFAVDPMDGILNYPDGPIRHASVTVNVR